MGRRKRVKYVEKCQTTATVKLSWTVVSAVVKGVVVV